MRKAFTLVELLVVISIIAALSTILVPAFFSAREKARQDTCLSNERQLGIAFLQYEQDNDEMFPYGYGGTGAYAYRADGWAYSIYPYVKSTSIFACPDDPTVVPTPPSWHNGEYDYVVSYAFNLELHKVNVAAQTAPSKTALLVETTGLECNVLGYSNPPGWPSGKADYSFLNGNLSPGTEGLCLYGPNQPTALFSTGYLGGRGTGPCDEFATSTGRHSGGSNITFADGHAKWLLGSTVSSGQSAVSATCDQGGVGTGCGGYANSAAGTSNTNWAATFSAI